ncbi:MAG: hypothetical protein KIG70_10075 [Treponema sp.]|uniref:phage protease n=1 Tax=Treponema sp. TaxID=166 RepID=UPI001E003591|nr:phage protease [Treponema sp.]MBS7311511.1 hypothetical protein [Treponema sp.]
MEIISDTIDNGEIENVHLVPIGDFKGSDKDGNPIDEHITKESLDQIAEKLNSGDEVLCDIDHQSCKPGVERDSKAAGWFHKFVVDPVKGLFASLKLTKKGREIVENREYRYTSPVFTLDENGNPNDIHSVALTNVPAFKGHISPIINSEPTEINKEENLNKEIINMEITKEDLIELIKNTVNEMNIKKEINEEIREELVGNSCDKKQEELVENSCDKKQEEVKNEETVPETKEEVKEVKEEVKVEDKDEPKEEKEVIKIESLNSAPTPSMTQEPEWKKLHGKEFFDWYKKHQNCI